MTDNSFLSPQAVLFDWCDTLINTKTRINVKLVDKVFDEMRISRELVDIKQYENLEHCISTLFGNRWVEALDIYKKLRILYNDEVILNDGVIDMLAKFNEVGLYLAIVSNEIGSVLRKQVASVELTRYFNKIVGFDDTPFHKPSPEPIFAALEDSDIIPSNRVMFIGDSLTDVECANKAGCLPVMYGVGYGDIESGVLSFEHFNSFSNFVLNLLSK